MSVICRCRTHLNSASGCSNCSALIEVGDRVCFVLDTPIGVDKPSCLNYRAGRANVLKEFTMHLSYLLTIMMFVRMILVRTTSDKVEPASSNAIRIISKHLRACAEGSPGPTVSR